MTTLNLTENAITVLKARYLLGNEQPEDLFRRVAHAIAEAEAPENRAQWEETFFAMMVSTKFVPNSPTLFNAGTGKGTLSACFVLPVEDTMESIMQASTNSAMIQKFGGGLGYAFSKLRPRGSPIATTQGKSCGPVAVLKMLSALSDMITQGGKRHGANMGILHVSHPEIMDFIHMKDDNATAQNFNISVAISDAFMEAVEYNKDWDLIDPHTGGVAETLSAREMWNDIIKSAWKTGDPGLYFIDEANRHNPTPHLGNLDSTNPCGEVPLLAHEACNLGSIDLGQFVVNGQFDFTGLEDLTRTAARFLDNVVSVNEFPAQAVKDAVALTRKTGLGVMGWHDTLIQMNIAYDSEEALELANRVMGTINNVARGVSIKLAEERGAYPACQEEVPIRNATRTCIAPTGSISAIAGASSGIEPIFALAFVKNVLDGKQLREVNPQFLDMAHSRGFFSEELMDEMAKTGSCQHLDQVPEDIKRLFKVANEIPLDTHIKMQAAFQAHTDLAVSKTINMPNSATPQDVARAYWLSYQNACKGITVYRDGSKPTQVLEVERKKKSTPTMTREVHSTPRARPLEMHGVTERIRTGHGNLFVTINFDAEEDPFEVFTTLGKAGGCDSANLEAVSRLASLALRSGIQPDQIIEQLQGITCHPVWDQGSQVRSAPDALAMALKHQALPSGTVAPEFQNVFGAQLGLPINAKMNGTANGNGNNNGHSVANGTQTRHACPECGSPTAFQEGCEACLACAWNQCGG
jgi:ribonucleoside-diphosphate reductase alpha chain